ncbi:MAG TPA: hypothetical protein VKZ53_06745 [Candidatus Angelobacter sp.]|nr:hypothetical protein [Candidatus Angelobacter sp.]
MNRRERLKRELTILASDANAQLKYLKDLGLPQDIDELALDYDAIAAAGKGIQENGEIDFAQYECATS